MDAYHRFECQSCQSAQQPDEDEQNWGRTSTKLVRSPSSNRQPSDAVRQNDSAQAPSHSRSPGAAWAHQRHSQKLARQNTFVSIATAPAPGSSVATADQMPWGASRVSSRSMCSTKQQEAVKHLVQTNTGQTSPWLRNRDENSTDSGVNSGSFCRSRCIRRDLQAGLGFRAAVAPDEKNQMHKACCAVPQWPEQRARWARRALSQRSDLALLPALF